MKHASNKEFQRAKMISKKCITIKTKSCTTSCHIKGICYSMLVLKKIVKTVKIVKFRPCDLTFGTVQNDLGKISQLNHVTDSYQDFIIIIIKGKRNIFFFIVNSYNVIIYDNDRQTLHPDKQAKYTRAYSWIHHNVPVWYTGYFL